MSLLAAAAEADKIPAIKGKAATGLRSLTLIMNDLRQILDAPADEIIRQVIEKTGYRLMLKKSDDPDDQERLANVEELITAARQFVAEDESRTLADFLENITLASDVDGYDETQDCVSVMTLHAAKGLEFPVVYMVAVEQGLLPHERSLASDDLEEERRLAFVGMTRAKEELHLSHARLREFRGQTLYAVQSMFLDELPTEGIETQDLSASGAGRKPVMDSWRGGHAAADLGWNDAGVAVRGLALDTKAPPLNNTRYEEGMVVRHDTYGTGKVIYVGGHGVMRKVKIRFQAGERTFIADKARLEIVT
jgi:DNA helicase-2/ATP-dependent DNA helicase PcrA